MAYRNQTTHKTQCSQGSQRPRECKVCIDAGKPEAEYTSHWVKDRSGNVTCPTLLNQKCLMCGNCGHTSSYCKVQIDSGPKISATAATAAVEKRATTAIAVKTKPVARPMSSNKYALLAIVEQEDELSRDRHTASFPPLEKKPEITRPTIATTTTTTTSGLNTWASRINSPPSQPQQEQPRPFRQLPRRPTRSMQIAVSWADQCCD